MGRIKFDKSKSEIVSFAVSPDMARAMKKIPFYTRWIGTLVSINLGICPCCGGPMKGDRDGRLNTQGLIEQEE
jgi:hypothetical protein